MDKKVKRTEDGLVPMLMYRDKKEWNFFVVKRKREFGAI